MKETDNKEIDKEEEEMRIAPLNLQAGVERLARIFGMSVTEFMERIS